jgi:DNA-binding XRE family transcriptional regulator
VIQIKQSVKEFRTAKKMSKAALARRLGVARSYITKVENEQLQPSGPVMLRFAHVLQRSVGDIFQLTEVPSGHAAFQPISRRASVRADETNSPAELNRNNKR